MSSPSSKLVPALILIAVLLGVFVAGRFVGRLLSSGSGNEDNKNNATASNHFSARRSNTTASAQGYVRAEDLSANAQALIALHDPSAAGGAQFLNALVDLTPEELDALVDEFRLNSLPRHLRGVAMLIYQRWAEVDPKEKLSALFSPDWKDDAMRGHLASLAFANLALNDPIGAMALAGAVEDGVNRRRYLNTVLHSWSKRDPSAAAQAMIGHGLLDASGNEGGHMMAMVARSWAESDPVAAASFVEGMPVGSARGRGVGEIAEVWAKSDPGAALRWVHSLENLGSREVTLATGRIIGNAVDHQPEFVREFINTAEGSKFVGGAVRRLAMHYAGSDSPSAVEWFQTLEGYDTLSHAGHGLVEGLQPGDIASFNEVIAALPPGARDPIMSTFTARWAMHQPQEAIAWAKTLELRERQAATDGILYTLDESEALSGHAEMAELVGSDPRMVRNWAGDLAESWARRNSREAFAWASGLEVQSARGVALRK